MVDVSFVRDLAVLHGLGVVVFCFPFVVGTAVSELLCAEFV